GETPAAFGAPSAAAALGTPFGRRCIPAPPHGAQSAPWGPRADCVAPPSNIPDILGRHALSAGRLAALGATLDFHHGLLRLPDAAAQRRPTIAAAANLNFALTEIARQFERERGTRVDVVFGASGTLTRQIRDGAPFEMFLAADEEFPGQLTAAGLTRDAGAVYAIGRLVLFA